MEAAADPGRPGPASTAKTRPQIGNICAVAYEVGWYLGRVVTKGDDGSMNLEFMLTKGHNRFVWDAVPKQAVVHCNFVLRSNLSLSPSRTLWFWCLDGAEYDCIVSECAKYHA